MCQTNMNMCLPPNIPNSQYIVYNCALDVAVRDWLVNTVNRHRLEAICDRQITWYWLRYRSQLATCKSFHEIWRGLRVDGDDGVTNRPADGRTRPVGGLWRLVDSVASSLAAATAEDAAATTTQQRHRWRFGEIPRRMDALRFMKGPAAAALLGRRLALIKQLLI